VTAGCVPTETLYAHTHTHTQTLYDDSHATCILLRAGGGVSRSEGAGGDVRVKSEHNNYHQMTSMPFLCPECTPQEPCYDTYASVRAQERMRSSTRTDASASVGAGQLANDLEDSNSTSICKTSLTSYSNYVADLSAYCIRCKCITPSFNGCAQAQVSVGDTGATDTDTDTDTGANADAAATAANTPASPARYIY
jgi:hypothetical protein